MLISNFGGTLFTKLLQFRYRWTPKRHMKEVQAQIYPYVGPSIAAKTFDISQTGVFIEGHEEDLTQAPLHIGERINFNLSIGSLGQIRCEATVIRRSNGYGRYPKGLGLKFENLDRKQLLRLKSYLRSAA